MKVVNLTPHDINIVGGNGVVRTIKSSGVVRCTFTQKALGTVDGIPVTVNEYGEVEGLPEPKKGTIYIVSRIAAERANRQDVLTVGPVIKDPLSGRPLGVRSLSAVVGFPELD